MEEGMIRLFESLLDSQRENTKVLTQVRDESVRQSGTLKEINSQFSNGFKSEILDKIHEVDHKVNKTHLLIVSPSLWVKLIVGGLIAIATITTVTVKAVDFMSNPISFPANKGTTP